MDTNKLEQIIESYLNGNLNDTKEAIYKMPYLQTEIYIALPADAKDLFMQRCRKWHEALFKYN